MNTWILQGCRLEGRGSFNGVGCRGSLDARALQWRHAHEAGSGLRRAAFFTEPLVKTNDERGVSSR